MEFLIQLTGKTINKEEGKKKRAAPNTGKINNVYIIYENKWVPMEDDIKKGFIRENNVDGHKCSESSNVKNQNLSQSHLT